MGSDGPRIISPQPSSNAGIPNWKPVREPGPLPDDEVSMARCWGTGMEGDVVLPYPHEIAPLFCPKLRKLCDWAVLALVVCVMVPTGESDLFEGQLKIG
jgi:hypothetical protein